LKNRGSKNYLNNLLFFPKGKKLYNIEPFSFFTFWVNYTGLKSKGTLKKLTLKLTKSLTLEQISFEHRGFFLASSNYLQFKKLICNYLRGFKSRMYFKRFVYKPKIFKGIFSYNDLRIFNTFSVYKNKAIGFLKFFFLSARLRNLLYKKDTFKQICNLVGYYSFKTDFYASRLLNSLVLKKISSNTDVFTNPYNAKNFFFFFSAFFFF